jgi:hypothetical protein
MDGHPSSELRVEKELRGVLYQRGKQQPQISAAHHKGLQRFKPRWTKTVALPVTLGTPHLPKPQAGRLAPQDWYWEGNVQSHMVRYLVLQGYRIRSVANTLSRQQGIDIVAEKGGQVLWVTVKGYPRATESTHPSVQAPHWFKQAIFDIIEYRGRDKRVSLAIALPDFARYRALARRIAWLKPAAGFLYFWIRESDETLVE